MFLYLVRRSDRRSKRITAAQRRQAMMLTWIVAFAVVMIAMAVAG
jgi:hypothetical protein